MCLRWGSAPRRRGGAAEVHVRRRGRCSYTMTGLPRDEAAGSTGAWYIQSRPREGRYCCKDACMSMVYQRYMGQIDRILHTCKRPSTMHTSAPAGRMPTGQSPLRRRQPPGAPTTRFPPLQCASLQGKLGMLPFQLLALFRTLAGKPLGY